MDLMMFPVHSISRSYSEKKFQYECNSKVKGFMFCSWNWFCGMKKIDILQVFDIELMVKLIFQWFKVIFGLDSTVIKLQLDIDVCVFKWIYALYLLSQRKLMKSQSKKVKIDWLFEIEWVFHFDFHWYLIKSTIS